MPSSENQRDFVTGFMALGKFGMARAIVENLVADGFYDKCQKFPSTFWVN